MPRRQRSVPARGKVLRWARDEENLSLERAAMMLGISQNDLSAIEGGKREPTTKEFEYMQSVYRRSESVLLLPDVPPTKAEPTTFRTVGGRREPLTQETRLVIRRVRGYQERLTELFESDSQLLPKATIKQASLRDDPEEVAGRERAIFDVPIDLQRAWKPRADSFRKWRAKVEERGVLVFLESMPWADCRGFSLVDADSLPTIVINSEDWPNSQIFTLFHEYAHIALN